MIQNLSIDLETRSSVDIVKSSVYRYAESDDFDILLFGVSVNHGPIRVYDLAQGDTVPADILKALALDVKGGTTVEIPAEGLEKIDLNAGIMNISFTDSEKPDARKSRPALP